MAPHEAFSFVASCDIVQSKKLSSQIMLSVASAWGLLLDLDESSILDSNELSLISSF